MIYKQPPSWLAHHGVEGQRWGVRHGPPYPIQDTILRRGTRLNSVSKIKKSSEYKNKNRMLYTYRPDEPIDVEIYRGPFTKFLRSYYSDWNSNLKTKVFEHEFKTLRDLRMPTSKQRMDEFIKLYNESKGETRKTFTSELNDRMRSIKELDDIGSVTKGLENYNLGEFKKDPYDGWVVSKNNVNTKLSGKSAESAYTLFNRLMEVSYGYEITRQYVKNIMEKWDAMVDDNNAGIYNGARDPIIIFDPRHDLSVSSKKDKGRHISVKEMQSNIENVKRRNGGTYAL